jgi:hypothetical protein
MFEALFFLAASLLITALFTPRTQQPSPPAFSDFDFPQADEGTPQAVYFGECWSTSWMVLAVGDYRVTPIRKKGGKK